jgi:hypothetical protein
LIETCLILLASAAKFLENKLGDDITIVGGRGTYDFALFLELACNPIQRFVGQVIGRGAAPPIEVTRQPTAHFKISLAIGVNTFVQPIQELTECLWIQNPILLQLCHGTRERAVSSLAAILH